MEKYVIKECKKHGSVNFVREARGYHRCTKCRSDNVQRRRRRIKKQLIEDFGGKCKICGYTRCIDNLVFHHRDPNEKEFGISHRGITKSYKRAKIEAEKCELLCCRCHGEVHAGLINL